mmetsp:Transcript_37511/g.43788  ORF Transcript_37511/g.43788 Transcript_37511/m.43788 type:complete len:223 (+) Transcript_37511:645-1313(+)
MRTVFFLSFSFFLFRVLFFSKGIPVQQPCRHSRFDISFVAGRRRRSTIHFVIVGVAAAVESHVVQRVSYGLVNVIGEHDRFRPVSCHNSRKADTAAELDHRSTRKDSRTACVNPPSQHQTSIPQSASQTTTRKRNFTDVMFVDCVTALAVFRRLLRRSKRQRQPFRFLRRQTLSDHDTMSCGPSTDFLPTVEHLLFYYYCCCCFASCDFSRLQIYFAITHQQ